MTSDDRRIRDKRRDNWDEDEDAVNDLVSCAPTAAAPWTLRAANDKRDLRVKALCTVADTMAPALKRTSGVSRKN